MIPGSFSATRLISGAVLAAVIITSGIFVWVRYDPPEEIAIFPAETPPWTGTIYIGGNVSLPGFYPCTETDTIRDLMDAAGGISPADGNYAFELTVSDSGGVSPQKIDLNRADAWLLQALPGIGETMAERILAYRAAHGGFRNTLELMRVEGIGPVVFAKIEPFITVSE